MNERMYMGVGNVIYRFQSTKPVYFDGGLNQFIIVRKNIMLSRFSFLILLETEFFL